MQQNIIDKEETMSIIGDKRRDLKGLVVMYHNEITDKNYFSIMNLFKSLISCLSMLQQQTYGASRIANNRSSILR